MPVRTPALRFSCDPNDCAGYILPMGAVVPWQVTFGGAWRFGASPWNHQVDGAYRDERQLTIAVDLSIMGPVDNGFGMEAFAAKHFKASDRIRLSPATTRLREAQGWLKRVGSTLDGIIAKRRDVEYRSDDRGAMQKIKNYRSADCVVGGFRYNEGKPLVGSLLLGLYDEGGLLHHVGFTATIPRAEKPALTTRLRQLIAPPGFTGNAPGGPSRWSSARSAEWEPLRPELVVEVAYDHFTGHRFRHGTKLLRWRPDKAPKQCTLDQVKQKKANLMKLLAQ